jgi:TatD DNase family protein
MPIQLVDTHCHLDFTAFDDDLDAVIRRALDAGVTRMVVPAVDAASIPRVLSLSDQHPPVYCAVGLHPNDIPGDADLGEVIQSIRQHAANPKVIAIGEIGLDYYWQKTTPAIQHDWLRGQLDLAARLELPVILHNRQATADLLEVLSSWVKELPTQLRDRPGVLHSFSAAWEDASVALDLGFYLGFTGPVTYKNAGELREVAANTPIERILLETDAPFLPPHPHRGQRNEPAHVRLVAEKLAEIRGTDPETIGHQTSRNAALLFNWSVA